MLSNTVGQKKRVISMPECTIVSMLTIVREEVGVFGTDRVTGVNSLVAGKQAVAHTSIKTQPHITFHRFLRQEADANLYPFD